MPTFRKTVFANDNFYHIFNKSVDNKEIFKTRNNINRALELIQYYKITQQIRYSQFVKLTEKAKSNYLNRTGNNPKLINILAYSLMPNHFHLLLQQKIEKGIVRFISNFQNSFAKYFNLTNAREGSLFKNPFKAVQVDGESQLLHVSRYIHLNPPTSNIINFNKLKTSLITSLPEYISKTSTNITERNLIIDLIGDKIKYEKFVEDNKDYQKSLHLIQHHP